ncbi:hypothetical protein P7K49_030873, partial [Saguinus oedipus]
MSNEAPSTSSAMGKPGLWRPSVSHSKIADSMAHATQLCQLHPVLHSCIAESGKTALFIPLSQIELAHYREEK